jgi:dihydroorotate dehydrogenase (NAD+) catalytic subunit
VTALLATEFCGLELRHPVVNGSGTFDVLAARRAFGPAIDAQLPFAAFVTKTVTLRRREGNPPPRLWEIGGGMINSIGLPNPGLANFLAEQLPRLATLPVPLIVSVMGFDAGELSELVTAVGERPEVAAIELNFSCPNVETGTVVGADAGEMDRMVGRLRPLTTRPLIVKLAPQTAAIGAVARAGVEAGADAVSLINTLPGTALAPGTRQPWLGGGGGGVSGPAVRAVALAQVTAVADAVEVPIIGMGGVEAGRHAADLLAAGATLVAVGTESFRDPAAGRRIVAELASELGAAR